ncbi:leucine-rich repeat-containing protein 25-like [Zootoca vivipara]|uniref:leucine-rich repeat-containing protein 25-like n=1 Tax=Zootoca vivipara TaxID=8524 RepID=UPI00293C0081|nr:leucine-rich repeat-containing protein 25-like [Zootoca vivipara]
MWRLLATAVFCLLGRPVYPKCPLYNQTHPPEALARFFRDSAEKLALAGCGVPKIPDDTTLGPQVEELDLSRNDLRSLPDSFLSRAAKVRKLHLSDIGLRELPPQFFANASGLKELWLENNTLRSVPAGAFHGCLEKLAVDCQCPVAGSVLPYCQNCSADTECLCFTLEGRAQNVTDFHAQQCQGMPGSLYAAIVVPIVVVVLLAGLVCFLIRRKVTAAISHDKRGSTASEGVHGQPRYISHAGPQGDASHSCHANYENIDHGAGARQGKRRASKPSTSRLSPEAPDPDVPHDDQPVYANTQDLYYNYSGGPTLGNAEDDIYIVPDQ